MIIYCISYGICFIFTRLGWFLPSGLVLVLAGLWLYLKDYRATGNLIHLRGLFCLFFIGGQGLSCMKLSRLQREWTMTAWLCFFLAVVIFYLVYGLAEGVMGQEKSQHWMKKQARGKGSILPWENRMELRKFEQPLFTAIMAITLLSSAAFLTEALILGYIPFFLRGVPHAYSYFHISGIHYITVSCVLVPSFYLLYFLAKDERKRGKNILALIAAAVSLGIPVLCVSRFQLILAVGMAAFTAISVNRRIRILHVVLLIVVMIPAYLVLTIARSHDVAYLNGIFQMKSSAMPIFITQPYMYIAHNYDNFDYLVAELPQHSHGMRMLFPLWALTGLKFLIPGLVNYPIYVNKEELTTLTLIYDAYYDFGIFGVVLFSALLGFLCCLLSRGMKRLKNPVAYVVYAQIAMYMMLSFFTTWFSNPATWFYLAVTGMVYLYVEYR